MQEAQASKKAGRGNRAWDPCFATPGPRRLRLVERHQIAARSLGGGGRPPPPPPRIRRRAGGGLGGGVILYPLLGVRHAEQCRRIWEVQQVAIVAFPEHGVRGAGGMELQHFVKVAFCVSGDNTKQAALRLVLTSHQS